MWCNVFHCRFLRITCKWVGMSGLFLYVTFSILLCPWGADWPDALLKSIVWQRPHYCWKEAVTFLIVQWQGRSTLSIPSSFDTLQSILVYSLCMRVIHVGNFTGWKEALYVHYLPADRRRFMFSPQRHTQTDSKSHLRDARWKESDKISAIHKTPRPFNSSVSTIYLSNTKTWVCKNRQISSVWFSDGVQTYIFGHFLFFLLT